MENSKYNCFLPVDKTEAQYLTILLLFNIIISLATFYYLKIIGQAEHYLSWSYILLALVSLGYLGWMLQQYQKHNCLNKYFSATCRLPHSIWQWLLFGLGNIFLLYRCLGFSLPRLWASQPPPHCQWLKPILLFFHGSFALLLIGWMLWALGDNLNKT